METMREVTIKMTTTTMMMMMRRRMRTTTTIIGGRSTGLGTDGTGGKNSDREETKEADRKADSLASFSLYLIIMRLNAVRMHSVQDPPLMHNEPCTFIQTPLTPPFWYHLHYPLVIKHPPLCFFISPAPTFWYPLSTNIVSG
jgi:hypothetical protein